MSKLIHRVMVNKMSDKTELEVFDALKLLTEFFIENELDSETMAYMVEAFYSAIDEDETPRMALSLAKHVFDTDYDQAN